MRTLLQLLLSRPVSVGMGCVAVAVGGLVAMVQLPVGLAPTLELPALSIYTSWGGASAESVEQTLTAPVEEIVSSLKGIRRVRSASHEGRSRVIAEFDRRANMSLLRMELNERLSLFAQQRPRLVSFPVVVPYTPDEIERLHGFLSYSLTGSLPRSALARLAREEIIPRLLSVEGVAQVSLDGGDDQEIRVALSAEKSAALGVTTQDVASALESCRPGICTGAVQGPAGPGRIIFDDEAMSPGELGEIAVREGGEGAPIRVRDVATITLSPSSDQELLRFNGKECLTLTLTRDVQSSLPGTARDVRACIAALLSSLPRGVELVCEMDRSRRMAEELDRLMHDALFSILLLAGMLVLFLGRTYAPALLLIAMLLSVAGTLLMFWILRLPLHLLTLAGLTLGMGRLLDDSIVVLENLRRWNDSGTSIELVLNGTQEVIMPVVASTATMVGAMLPVFFVSGDLQMYLREMAFAITISLCISLLVSFTVIPVAALRRKTQGTGILLHPRGRISAMYRRFLGGALRHRAWVLAAVIWLFGIPAWLLPARWESPSLFAQLYNETLGGNGYAVVRPVVNALLGGVCYQFFSNVPHADPLDPGSETVLVLQLSFPQGVDISSANAVATVLERDLMNAGAPRVMSRVLPGVVSIRVDFSDSLAATFLPQALRDRCLRLAAQIGGAAVSVSGFGAGYSGGMEMQPSFTVRVLGYDYARVREIAESLREALSHNPRVTGTDIDKSIGDWSGAQEIALSMDREAIARYGLMIQDVAAAVRNYTDASAQQVPVKMPGMQLPCVITAEGSMRLSAEGLASIPVPGTQAAPVPLGQLLGVRQQQAPSEIVREDQSYVRWVSFEYRGPYRHAEAFLDATLRSMTLPEGYRVDRPGGAADSGENRSVLVGAALAALLVVLMVTASLYESWLNPLIILLSVPFAYVGVFLAFILTGLPFGTGGYFSVILLTGIAVSNGIVIVDFICRAEAKGGRSAQTIVDASACRLRPVLMTTLATIGTLMPMLFGEWSSVWHMLALGTLGGMVTSAALTLLVIPVVYAVLHKIKD